MPHEEQMLIILQRGNWENDDERRLYGSELSCSFHQCSLTRESTMMLLVTISKLRICRECVLVPCLLAVASWHDILPIASLFSGSSRFRMPPWRQWEPLGEACTVPHREHSWVAPNGWLVLTLHCLQSVHRAEHCCCICDHLFALRKSVCSI